MYLMYVDESGDTGLNNSPTTHFALSGLVIHERQWRHFTGRMVALRKTFKTAYGLPPRTEIHASKFIQDPPVPGMPRHIRLAILRNVLDEIARMDFISITNVIVSKAGKPPDYDVFDKAWQALFQGFENTLKAGKFPGAYRKDYGTVFTDATDAKKLRKMVRRISVDNPVPHRYWFRTGYRNLPILRVIEDPIPRDSAASFFIQACDVAAYFLLQKYKPNQFIRKQGATNYLRRLEPILNRRVSRDPLGIVEL
jgi:hypothetical protein